MGGNTMKRENLEIFEREGRFIFKATYDKTRRRYTKEGNHPYNASLLINVSTSDGKEILTDHIWLKNVPLKHKEPGSTVFFTAKVNRYVNKEGEESFRFNKYRIL